MIIFLYYKLKLFSALISNMYFNMEYFIMFKYMIFIYYLYIFNINLK